MYVDCLYRLYPYGEIHYGQYDTLRGTVLSMPTHGVFPLPSDWWAEGNYRAEGHVYNLSIIEYYMACREDCYLAIECVNLCFYACHTNGAIMLCYGDPEKCSQVYYFNNLGWVQKYKEIGYARTKTNQWGHAEKLRTFALCEDTSMIHLAGKWYNPSWEVTDCVGISSSYVGYKDAMLNGYDGVVYLQNQPYPVRRDDSNGILLVG